MFVLFFFTSNSHCPSQTYLCNVHSVALQVLYIKPFCFVKSKPNSPIQTFYSYRHLSGYVLLQLLVPEAIGDPTECLPSRNARSINSLLHKKRMLQVLNVQIKLNCFLKHSRVNREMAYTLYHAPLDWELANVTVRGFDFSMCLFAEGNSSSTFYTFPCLTLCDLEICAFY